MAVAQAQWETVFDDTFTGTPGLPYYQRGDVVWRKSEFDGKPSWYGTRKYTIQNIELVTFDDSGTERFADSTLTTEVTNAGTQPDDTTTGWFYTLLNESTNDRTYTVHESDLLNEAAMEAYLATKLAAFVA